MDADTHARSNTDQNGTNTMRKLLARKNTTTTATTATTPERAHNVVSRNGQTYCTQCGCDTSMPMAPTTCNR